MISTAPTSGISKNFLSIQGEKRGFRRLLTLTIATVISVRKPRC
jgi:hypothetical protein